MTTPLDDYEPRSWTTYQLSPEEGENIPSETVPDMIDLVSDSMETMVLARRDGWDVSNVFFSDFEQLVAGHDKHGSGPVFRLAQEFMGHEAGRLGFVSYEGMGEVPRFYTMYLEN